MDKYIGKMLDGRYEIIELIGSGGMANVYKAKCHRLNRMVAVKILKSDMAENEEIRRRFRDESRAVAQLSHANIVSVYDVSSSGDTEYIVMELIDGITLTQYMERRGQMGWGGGLHFIIYNIWALGDAPNRRRFQPGREGGGGGAGRGGGGGGWGGPPDLRAWGRGGARGPLMVLGESDFGGGGGRRRVPGRGAAGATASRGGY